MKELEWAEWVPRGPWAAPRCTGTAARGLAYERKFGRWVSQAYAGHERVTGQRSGPWIHFSDANGRGYAQPDHVVACTDRVLCFECKLTYHPHGVQQLDGLYGPLLSQLYRGLPVLKVLVFHNPPLIGEETGLVELPDLKALLYYPPGSWRQTHGLHWLGI